MKPSCVVILSVSTFLVADPLPAAESVMDLTHAAVLAPPNLGGPEERAVRMLVEEVEKRSLVTWERLEKWPVDRTPVILIGPAEGVRLLAANRGIRLPDDLGKGGREGYSIGVDATGAAPTIWVAGNDSRGVLFGVGRLVRELRLSRLKITLPAGFHETSAPRMPLRGHQLGYRPKTNSYDGWTVAMWEQYLRDLAVFGCNAIELIPPRSDDAADSPLFPLPPLRMMTEMSRLAGDYGLDVWIWYPALDGEYADPAVVELSLKRWAEVFRALPRIDAVFVPGGDPGNTRPKVLFALLEKQAANLRRFHPKAQMWVSPQSFNRAWLDEFFELLKQEPEWLAGVVYGPEVRLDLPAFRVAVPKRCPIRNYPDITHSRHCQYPVPDWDLAFALTQGREVSNPRPMQTAVLFRHARPHTNGFLSYSEGCHDDVNKMVWSALGWDERTDLRDVLRQYARYFIGPEWEERFAEGLLGLEQNWTGPVLENAGIDETLNQFRAMEREAGPRVKLNWRFQQALYRAYYDGYVRARLRHETDAEESARAKLREAEKLGSLKAMAEAEAILDRAAGERPAPELRARVFELAEALFQSIRAQLSVAKYHAIAVERGATLDTIDVPLTDAAWLRKELAAVRKLADEKERLARLGTMQNRTDPGPGGFYDDLGDPRRQPHLVRGAGWDKDPAFLATPLVGFSFRGMGPDPATPRAWWQHAESLYDTPLQLRYTGLDQIATYHVRVVYGRERRRGKVRLVANDRFEIHPYLSNALEPVEFDIPLEATTSGELTLSWSQEPGGGGTGRGCQVAEVWLIKKRRGR
jgi:hypothetical protein